MADFANGADLTLSSGFVASTQPVEQVSGFGRNVAEADVTPLTQDASSYKLMKFSQRIGTDPIQITCFYNYEAAEALPTLGTEVVLTLVYPGGAHELQGTGAIVASNTGDMVSDQVMMATLTFKMKGGTTGVEAPRVQAT